MVFRAIWNKLKQGLSKTRSLFGGIAPSQRSKPDAFFPSPRVAAPPTAGPAL